MVEEMRATVGDIGTEKVAKELWKPEMNGISEKAD